MKNPCRPPHFPSEKLIPENLTSSQLTSNQPIQSGAIFDPTGDYRYLLWRTWQPDARRLTFIMLNPSTADADRNDPTIRRCLQFAQTWGFGSLKVVNLFGFKATHPQILQQASDPIGTENDRYLLTAVQQAEQVIIAWGNWGALSGRDRAVLRLIQNCGLYCLGINRSGQPKHPLYLSGKTVPFLYSLFQADTKNGVQGH